MTEIPAKTILSAWKPNPMWFGTEYNINLYRGCSYGCIYCDSRSSCYHVEDFDRIRPKTGALGILERELGSRRRKGVVASGAMTDPYNPLEKKLELTSGALKLIHRARFGAAVATKSDLVIRDLPLFRDISSHSPVLIKMTVTCTDHDLAGKIEPGAPRPVERLKALEGLARTGLFAGILFMPLLPWLEDSEDNVLSVVRSAADAGARFVFPGFGVTIREGQREYFYDALDREFPGLSERYRQAFGESYGCARPHVPSLVRTFQDECRRLGVLYRMEDIIAASRRGYEEPEQLELFR